MLKQNATYTQARWSQAEVDALLNLVGSVPTQYLVERYSCWANKNGYPTRTLKALQHKWLEHGFTTCHCSSNTWIASSVVNSLCKKYRSRNFTCHLSARHGVRLIGRGLGAMLNRLDLRELAKTRPDLFGGIPRSVLYQILESDKLADFVSAQYPAKRSSVHPTTCVINETGERFPSLAAAATALNLTRDEVWRAVREEGKYCNGQFTISTIE